MTIHTSVSRAPCGKLARFAFGLCAATMEIVSLVLKGFAVFSHVVKPLWRATKGQTCAAVLFSFFFFFSFPAGDIYILSSESRTSLLGDTVSSPQEVVGTFAAL